MLLYRHRPGAVRATYHGIERYKHIWDYSLNDGAELPRCSFALLKSVTC